LVLDSVVTAVT